MGIHWFGELVTDPHDTPLQDEDDLAQARAVLKDGPKTVVLYPAAKLAWQQDARNIVGLRQR